LNVIESIAEETLNQLIEELLLNSKKHWKLITHLNLNWRCILLY